MVKDPELEALDREFNRPGSTMHVSEYNARCTEIRAREPWQVRAQAAAREQNEKAEKDEKFVTFGALKSAVRLIAAAIAKSTMPISSRVYDLEAHAKEIAPAISAMKGNVDRALDPIGTRLSAAEFKLGALSLILARGDGGEKIKDLENLLLRVKAIEERPTMEYRGVWSDSEEYRPGDFVSHSGSMFHCWAATIGGRPGASDCWQLAIKRGRDSR